MQSARSASDIHSSIAGIASEFPGMWQSLSERGTLRGNDGAPGAGKKLSRLEQAEKRMQDERSAKNKADYRRMLKDRLVTLKRKDILTAKKQMFRSKGALHAERVRNIKVKQQAEKLRRQQLSFRLRRQNLVETRMRKLNLSMIKSLHSSKREQVRCCERESQGNTTTTHPPLLTPSIALQELDDAMKIQALKREGGARAAALDAFFEERIGMAESAIRVQESERADTARAQESAIRSLLKELSKDSKARVERKLEKAAELEEQELRKESEATLALAQVIGVEDWEGIYKDRFMTPRVSEVQALTKNLDIAAREGLQGVKRMKRKQREKRSRELKSAYLSGVGRRSR